MYIRLLGMDIVVLNSPSVATDLLEKRSQIYSNRPFIATVDPYVHPSLAYWDRPNVQTVTHVNPVMGTIPTLLLHNMANIGGYAAEYSIKRSVLRLPLASIRCSFAKHASWS